MQEKFRAFDELPRTVVMSLHQGSSVVSMDYNPTQQTLLLGTLHFPNKFSYFEIHIFSCGSTISS